MGLEQAASAAEQDHGRGKDMADIRHQSGILRLIGTSAWLVSSLMEKAIKPLLERHKMTKSHQKNLSWSVPSVYNCQEMGAHRNVEAVTNSIPCRGLGRRARSNTATWLSAVHTLSHLEGPHSKPWVSWSHAKELIYKSRVAQQQWNELTRHLNCCCWSQCACILWGWIHQAFTSGTEKRFLSREKHLLETTGRYLCLFSGWGTHLSPFVDVSLDRPGPSGRTTENQ